MSKPFGQHVQRILIDKLALPPSRWKHHHVLFIMERWMTTKDRQFIVGDLFFSFFSLSSFQKYMLVLFDFSFSVSILIV